MLLQLSHKLKNCHNFDLEKINFVLMPNFVDSDTIINQ